MTKNEEQQLRAIRRYAENVLGQDTTGHDMTHIERVVRNAKKLQEKEGGSLFLIESSAYLHDVLDDKLVSDVEKAKQDLISFLVLIGVEERIIETILFIIDHVSFSAQLENDPIELTVEAKIVQDADRLDAIGAIGIARTFYYGGNKGHKMYDPTVVPRKAMTKSDYRQNETVLNHFDEKLFKLKELFQTEAGKKEADIRHQVMVDFVTQFKKEWEE